MTRSRICSARTGRRSRWLASLLALVTLSAGSSLARPLAPQLFCQVYPTAAECSGKIAACTTCHQSQPPLLNDYGMAILPFLRSDFDRSLPAALAAVEQQDSDEDGVDNLYELAAGTEPGSALSVDRGDGQAAAYDLGFAFRRVKIAFCGQSPSYEEVLTFAAAPSRAAIHAQLDTCLRSAYWRQQALPRMADAKIQPVLSMSNCLVPFYDIETDYNLFRWAMTDGRDVREVLTATYFVLSDDRGELSTADEASFPATRMGIRCGAMLPNGRATQNVPTAQRAGMWTSQSFLVSQTQGTLMPRVTAAAAYRNWLGYELARYEGIYPADNDVYPADDEPRDYDKKGVKAEPCVFCHQTLDPLSYAFAYYAGAPSGGIPFGGYGVDRVSTFGDDYAEVKAAWEAKPGVPRLFGAPFPIEAKLSGTSSLVQIARRAADSAAFARHIALLVFRHAVGGDPEPRDWPEFQQLWQGLAANGYSVDALVHALVDSNAFGAP